MIRLAKKTVGERATVDKRKVGFLPPSFCQETFLGGSSLGPDQSNLFIENEEHDSAFLKLRN